MKYTCNSPIYKAASLASALVIFMLCILPGFASADSVYPNEPVGWKDGDTFRNILAVVLDSWGISFTSESGNLQGDIDSILSDFYASENVLASEFWENAQFGANQLGQLILDNTTLGKIVKFANWLKSTYSLSNNNTISINPPSPSTPYISLNNGYVAIGNNYYYNAGGTVLNLNTVYFLSNGNTFELRKVSSTLYFYIVNNQVASQSNNGGINSYSFAYFYRNNQYNFQIFTYTQNINNVNSNTDRAGTISNIDPTIFGNSIVLNPGPPVQEPQIYIVTDVINIPVPAPDEGLQVDIPGTNWGDSIYTILDLIERLLSLYDSTQLNINSVLDILSNLLSGLQQSVTVENIPGAVVLDYDDYDIPLETDWSLVDGFFSNDLTTNPFSTISSIVYGFPEPLIIFFSVIIIFVVAYGFIRMGRDSH